MRDKKALAVRDEKTYKTIEKLNKHNEPATSSKIGTTIATLGKGGADWMRHGEIDHSLRRLKRAGRIVCLGNRQGWAVVVEDARPDHEVSTEVSDAITPTKPTTISEVLKLGHPSIE